VFFPFSVSMPCDIFSSVSSNWLGASWLELKEPLTVFVGGLTLSMLLSSFIFFAERGDAWTFVRVVAVSARARFAGALVTVPAILVMSSIVATNGDMVHEDDRWCLLCCGADAESARGERESV
jgi:hypothetical protein